MKQAKIHSSWRALRKISFGFVELNFSVRLFSYVLLLLFFLQAAQTSELEELRRERKVIIQGQLLKNALRDSHMWDHYVRKDAEWLRFPAEMRTYIEQRIAARNSAGHADVVSVTD